MIGGSKKLRKELLSQIPKDRKVKTARVRLVTTLFVKEKARMLAAFDAHPVTRELRGGTNASNITGTMQRGNLFGFIGFSSGSDPISSLRDALQKINIRPKFERSKTGEVIYMIDIPEPEKLYEVTPSPWAKGRSWLQGVEHGMSGLGRYLDTESPHSRSGGGIQSKHITHGGAFTGVTYITNGGILTEFANRLTKLSSGSRSIITS
jgi:hypothetical protein